MTEQLSTQKCEACQAGALAVTDEELAVLLKEIPDWRPIVKDIVTMLE